MVASVIEAGTFLSLGVEMMGKERSGMSEEAIVDLFKTFFGTTPEILSQIWDLLYKTTNFFTDVGKKTKPEHLLWAFAKMKVYEKEGVMTSIVATSKKGAPCGRTFRDKTWNIIAAISTLFDDMVSNACLPTIRLLVSVYLNICSFAFYDRPILPTTQAARTWESRLDDVTAGMRSLSVDGTDLRIPEEYPFSTGNFSHKFNGPGARFQICLDDNGDIASIEGPYRCGYNTERVIFEEETMPDLEPGEIMEGDGYYRRNLPNVFVRDNDNEERRVAMLRRARHEKLNGMLKRYGCLHNKFVHGFEKLGWCFRAVAVVTQLELNSGRISYGFDPRDVVNETDV